MTYTISDFRKNMKENGLKTALQTDLYTTKESHPQVMAILDGIDHGAAYFKNGMNKNANRPYIQLTRIVIK